MISNTSRRASQLSRKEQIASVTASCCPGSLSVILSRLNSQRRLQAKFGQKPLHKHLIRRLGPNRPPHTLLASEMCRVFGLLFFLMQQLDFRGRELLPTGYLSQLMLWCDVLRSQSCLIIVRQFCSVRTLCPVRRPAKAECVGLRLAGIFPRLVRPRSSHELSLSVR